MSPVPPPKASPQVPRDPELDAYDPPRHDTREMPVTVGLMRKSNRWTRVLMVVVGSLMGGGGGLGGGWMALHSLRAEAQEAAKAVIDAGMEQSNARLTRLEKIVEQHLDSDAAYKIRQEDRDYRAAIETRELQKVVLTGHSSPILNEPPPAPPVPVKDAGR